MKASWVGVQPEGGEDGILYGARGKLEGRGSGGLES